MERIIAGILLRCLSTFNAVRTIHVSTLVSVVGFWEWRAGVVGCEDVEGAGLGLLHQPDESGAEHGGGGSKEVFCEGFDRAKVIVDVFDERFGHGDGFYRRPWVFGIGAL